MRDFLDQVGLWACLEWVVLVELLYVGKPHPAGVAPYLTWFGSWVVERDEQWACVSTFVSALVCGCDQRLRVPALTSLQ